MPDATKCPVYMIYPSAKYRVPQLAGCDAVNTIVTCPIRNACRAALGILNMIDKGKRKMV